MKNNKPSETDDIKSKVKELAFDALFQQLPVTFYWMDINGIMLGCNDNLLKLLNLSSIKDYTGKHVTEVSSQTTWENSKQVMTSGETFYLEEIHVKENSEKTIYLSIKTPIFDESQNVTGLLGISIDITERKRQEEELRIAKEKAEAASVAKTQFLAVASHELRSPLVGILGVADILNKETISPQELKHCAKMLKDSGAYLLSNVNSILDFAKLEADKFDLMPAPIDLKSLVEEITTMLTAHAKERGLDLQIDYQPKTPTNILSDSRALRQVLTNLIGNAIKYTDTGTVTTQVRALSQNKKTVKLEINVIDTGIGVPKDKLELIFDRFEQVEDAETRISNKRSGTGIGLSTVKKLAELMGGSVHATSELGKGSVFHFIAEFPLQDEAIKQLPWSLYASQVRVLVIDDTPRAEILCKHLASNNCSTISGKSALNTLISAQQMGEPYDVIIVDQDLQTEDATTLLKQINAQKNLRKAMSMLLVSKPTLEEINKAKKANYFATFTKPVQPIAFQTALTAEWERWIELRDKESRAASEKQKIKTLLVDDDQIARYVHSNMFNEMGCETQTAESGKDALEKISKNHEIVFVDIGLPDMSGYELIKKIRKQNNVNKIPIIALTAHMGQTEKQKCLDAGANEVAVKPISRDTLREILERYVVKR